MDEDCGKKFKMWGTREEMLENDPTVFCGKEDETSKSPHDPASKPFRCYPPRKYTLRSLCSNRTKIGISRSPGYPGHFDPTAFGYGALELYELEGNPLYSPENVNYSRSPGLFTSGVGASPLGAGLITGGGAALGGTVAGAPGAVAGGALGGLVSQPDQPLGTVAGGALGALGGGLGYGVGGPLGAGLGAGLGGALGSSI